MIRVHAEPWSAVGQVKPPRPRKGKHHMFSWIKSRTPADVSGIGLRIGRYGPECGSSGSARTALRQTD